MTATIFLRIILAVVFCVVLFLLLPPVFRLIGLELSSDLLLVLKVCIGGAALVYIITGRPAIV